MLVNIQYFMVFWFLYNIPSSTIYETTYIDTKLAIQKF